MMKKLGLLGLTASLALLAGIAQAATTQSSFQVTANITNNCAITATNLAFGTYDTTNPNPLDAVSQVSVNCTNGQAYSVQMGLGINGGGTIYTRQMGNGAQRLNYSLFYDPARSLHWGMTNNADTVINVGNGVAQTYQVYGRIPAGQVVTAGAYSDTMTVTVEY